METNTKKIESAAAETPKKGIFSKPWVRSIVGILLIALVVGSALVYKNISSHISIDRSIISAPVIAISPQTTGILDEVYVHSGDHVVAGQALARVGSEILTSKIDGLVIDVSNTPGQVFTGISFVGSASVVKMIDPNQLRIIGIIKENEGLADIHVGDPVSFTVDAFGGKQFVGTVESISATSRESGLAFSISDKREVKEFDIKVKYDVAAHPEFKNGMSAKMSVFKK
ncbi:MAG: hypothetical protein JWO73_672 [Candidatus Taylorbacteria bacterium]|nr:hypothetical protein [Candidatus Taylorbacteria bacterium]